MSNPIAPFSFAPKERRRTNPYENVDLPTKKPQANLFARQQSSGSGKPPGLPASTSSRGTGSGATTRLPPGAFGSPNKIQNIKDIEPSLNPHPPHDQPSSTSLTPKRSEGAAAVPEPPNPSTDFHHAPEEMSSVSRSKSMSFSGGAGGGVGTGTEAGTEGRVGLKEDPDVRNPAAFGIVTGEREASFQSQNSSFQNPSFQNPSFQKPSSRTSAPAAAQPSNPMTASDSAPAPPLGSHPEPRRQPSQHSHSHLSRRISDRYQEYPATDQRIKEEVVDHRNPHHAAFASSHAGPQAESDRQRPNFDPLSTGHTGPTQTQPASDVFGQVDPGQTLPPARRYSFDPPASQPQRDVKPFPNPSNQSSYSETNNRAHAAHQLSQSQPPSYPPHQPLPLSASESLAIKQELHSDATLPPTERERSSSFSLPYPGQQWGGVQDDPAEETTPMWKAMQIQEQHFQKQINKLAKEKDQLRVELQRKEEASVHTSDQLQESQTKCLNLEKRFDEANRAKEDMGVRARKTLDTMKRQVESLNGRVREVNKTVEEGRRIDDDKLEDIKDDLKTFKEDLRTLREGPDGSDGLLAKYAQNVKALRDSHQLCKDLLAARGELASKLKIEEDSVERYRKQVRAATEDGKKDRERVAELEKQLKEMEQKLEEKMRVTKDQCEALVEKLQDALPGREALQRQVKELEKELEKELVLRDLGATKAAEDKVKLEDLQHELEAYVNAFKSLDIDVCGEEDELETLPELVQGAVKQIKAAHTSEVATWKARVNTAADQMASLAAELKATQQQLENSKVHADSAVAKELAKAMGFTSEKAKLEQERAGLEKELGEAKGQLDRFRESIDYYRRSDQTLKDQVTAAKAEAQAAKRDLKDGIKKERDFTATVTATLEEKRQQVTKLETRLVTLQDEVERKNSALALSPGSADAREAHERLLGQRRDAEEKASLLESHVKTVTSLCDSLEARVRDLESSLEKSRDEVAEREEQLAELNSTLEALQTGGWGDSAPDQSQVAKIDQLENHIKQLEAEKQGMVLEMSHLKKKSAGPSALGKDAQAQEVQDLKKQLAESHAELERIEKGSKDQESNKEWTPLERYEANDSTHRENELIDKVESDIKKRWAKEDASKDNKIHQLKNALQKEKERAQGLQSALDEAKLEAKGRVPGESSGTKRTTLPARSDGQPSSPLSPATSSTVKKPTTTGSASGQLVSPTLKRALKTGPSKPQVATATTETQQDQAPAGPSAGKKRKVPALEPSDSTESIDPLLVGDVGDVIMGDEAKKSNKKARRIRTDFDTDDELEEDEATQAAPVPDPQPTVSTRPQRKASNAAKATMARTISTGSVEMPPSTNPGNKKGKGKGRAKGPK